MNTDNYTTQPGETNSDTLDNCNLTRLQSYLAREILGELERVDRNNHEDGDYTKFAPQFVLLIVDLIETRGGL